MPRTLGLNDVNRLSGHPKKDLVLYPREFDEGVVTEYVQLLNKMRPHRKEPEAIQILAAFFAAAPSGLTAQLARHYSFIQMDTTGKIRFSNKPPGWIRGHHKQKISGINTVGPEGRKASLQRIAEFVEQQKSPAARRKRIAKGGLAITLVGLLSALAADGIVSAPKVVSRFGAYNAMRRINDRVPGISPFRLERNKLTPEERSRIDQKDVQKFQKYTQADRAIGNFQARTRPFYLPAAFGAGAALALRHRPRWPLRRTQHRQRK